MIHGAVVICVKTGTANIMWRWMRKGNEGRGVIPMKKGTGCQNLQMWLLQCLISTGSLEMPRLKDALQVMMLRLLLQDALIKWISVL